MASYSKERLVETVAVNLECLVRILEYNLEHGLFSFRISSDIVPFASHPVCRVQWQKRFKKKLAEIGKFIRRHRMRISMHPDQFTLINSLKGGIFKRSVRELLYHARILDLMGLGMDARIQIHVGGVYGDKNAGIARFIERYTKLPEEVKRRLAIENDDISYTLADCLRISDAVGIPVIFDVFHHELNSSGESIARALEKAAVTWKKRDGILMVDYSSQKRNARKGSHSESIDMKQFSAFLKKSRGIDFDLMLEIKDKEKSAVKAVKAAENDPRLIAPRQKGNSPLLVTT